MGKHIIIGVKFQLTNVIWSHMWCIRRLNPPQKTWSDFLPPFKSNSGWSRVQVLPSYWVNQKPRCTSILPSSQNWRNQPKVYFAISSLFDGAFKKIDIPLSKLVHRLELPDIFRTRRAFFSYFTEAPRGSWNVVKIFANQELGEDCSIIFDLH